MVKVSVVICTRKRPLLLTQCLSAVSRLDPAPTRVIVVDNSPGDEETQRVARKFGADCVVEPRAGLSRARQRGMAECKTEAVAFLDDAAIPEPDWLQTLVTSSAHNKNAGSTVKVLSIDSRGRRKSPGKSDAKDSQ